MTSVTTWPPTELVGDSHGVVLGFFHIDKRWNIDIQRAPGDGSGNPDTANAEFIEEGLDGQINKYVDFRDSGSGPWFYRWRTSLPNCPNGDWGDWAGFHPREIPSSLPPLPLPEEFTVIQWEGEMVNTETGRAFLAVIDPERRIKKVEFSKKKPDSDTFSDYKDTWDNNGVTNPGVIGTDQIIKRSEELTLGSKHNAKIKGRITYTRRNGEVQEQEFLRMLTFDVDRTPELYRPNLRVGSGDGSVFVTVFGDEDVEHIYGRFSENSKPDPPDGSETDANAGEVSVGQTRLDDYDTGLDISRGSTVHAKLVGENSDGTLGPVVSLHLDRYDFDDIAEINSLDVGIDLNDLSVHVDVNGDEDVQNIYGRIQKGSPPNPPDGSETDGTAGEFAASNTQNLVNHDTGITATEGDVLYVKAVGENPDGELGPVASAQIPFSDALDLIRVTGNEIDDDGDGEFDTGEMQIEVVATHGSYDLDIDKKQGRSSSWDDVAELTDKTKGDTATATVELVEGLLSYLRVQVTRAGESNILTEKTFPFDPDVIPNVVNLSVTVADDGTARVKAKTDFDGADGVIYLERADGTDPSAENPLGDGTDDASIDLDPNDNNNDTRQGSHTFSTKVDKGDVIQVAARAESENGRLAPTENIVRDEDKRPGVGSSADKQPNVEVDFDGEDPNLQNFLVTAETGEDGGVPADLEYKWKAEFSPEPSETTYDHNGDGNDDWLSFTNDSSVTGEVNDTIEVNKPDKPTPARLVVILRDTSVGSAGNHPRDTGHGFAQPKAAGGSDQGVGSKVIPTSNDPSGSDYEGEPHGTIIAVHQ